MEDVLSLTCHQLERWTQINYSLAEKVMVEVSTHLYPNLQATPIINVFSSLLFQEFIHFF